MPRSGTTWLGKIFDSHPDTLYRHEPDSRGTFDTLPLFVSGGCEERNLPFVNQYLDRLPAIRDEKISASLPIFAKNYYSAPALALRKGIVFGMKVASRVFGSLAVPDVVDLSKRSDYTLVWKSIESLGRLGMLARVRPDARCVIIFRHPCGYVASVLRGESKRKFEGGTPSSEDWGVFAMLANLPQAKERNLDLPAIKRMTAVERLALKWALYYEHVLAETEGLQNVIAVRYEDFCERPMEETRRAFQHCRLKWAPETESFISSSTSHTNSEYYSVFKNPMEAAWKWRKELSSDDVRQIQFLASGFRAGAWYSGQS